MCVIRKGFTTSLNSAQPFLTGVNLFALCTEVFTHLIDLFEDFIMKASLRPDESTPFTVYLEAAIRISPDRGLVRRASSMLCKISQMEVAYRRS